MRLAILLVLVPVVAHAAPSAINIPETLKHDRELLTAHADAVCACKDQRCSDPHVDAVLAWKRDQTLMENNKHYTPYLAAVAADEAISSALQQFDDCNAALFVKASCKKRIESAAASSESPRSFATFATSFFAETSGFASY